jgi:hypothetical protein
MFCLQDLLRTFSKLWNDKTSLFFAIVYFKKFKLFFRVNSTRIAKSRRDLFIIRLIFRSCDIKSRMKKLALRDRKDESIFFKTNSCFFLREVRRFFIIRVMINVCKILSLSKNVFASNDKQTISFKKCLSISFFWMTSSFDWDMKFSWVVSTFRRIVNFLATNFSFAITTTTTTSFNNFLSYLFNQSFVQFVIFAWRSFIVFIKWTFLIMFLIMSLFKKSL